MVIVIDGCHCQPPGPADRLTSPFLSTPLGLPFLVPGSPGPAPPWGRAGTGAEARGGCKCCPLTLEQRPPGQAPAGRTLLFWVPPSRGLVGR